MTGGVREEEERDCSDGREATDFASAGPPARRAGKLRGVARGLWNGLMIAARALDITGLRTGEPPKRD